MSNTIAKYDTPIDPVDIFVKAGNELIQKSDFNNARTHFEKLLRSNPDNAMAYCQLGLIHFELSIFLVLYRLLVLLVSYF